MMHKHCCILIIGLVSFMGGCGSSQNSDSLPNSGSSPVKDSDTASSAAGQALKAWHKNRVALADAINNGDQAQIARLKDEQKEVTRRFYEELHKLPEGEKEALINRQAKMLEEFRMPQEPASQ